MKKNSEAPLANALVLVSDPYLDCYSPVLARDDRGNPRWVGSGTLLSIRECYFLITAAHVLDEGTTSELYLPGSKELIRLQLDGLKTKAPSKGGRNADKLDCGFVFIDPEKVPKLKERFLFLPVGVVDSNDSPQTGKCYRFCGFPWELQKADHGNQTLSGQRYTFLSASLTGTKYSKWGLTEALHIVARFPRDKVKNESWKRVHAPAPAGMSGGPIFSMAPTVANSGAQTFWVTLAGITIEYRDSDRILVGVRLARVLESIRLAYPDLSAWIPKSTTIEIVHQTGKRTDEPQDGRSRL